MEANSSEAADEAFVMANCWGAICEIDVVAMDTDNTTLTLLLDKES